MRGLRDVMTRVYPGETSSLKFYEIRSTVSSHEPRVRTQTMTVINRLSRLFKADVHAMLDRIEEPPLLLQQALRDMAQALAVNERRLKLLTDEETVLTQQHADSGAAAAEIQHELDLCLSAERDDLARGLLRQRLTRERA